VYGKTNKKKKIKTKKRKQEMQNSLNINVVSRRIDSVLSKRKHVTETQSTSATAYNDGFDTSATSDMVRASYKRRRHESQTRKEEEAVKKLAAQEKRARQFYNIDVPSRSTLVALTNFEGRVPSHQEVTIETEKCSHCPSSTLPLVFCPVLFTTRCIQCCRVTRVLSIVEDTANDVIVFRNSSSSLAPDAPDLVIGANAAPAQPTSRSTYSRATLYSKYLSQFLVTTPDAPPDVYDLVYRELSHIHLLGDTRCRPTPVVNILKANDKNDYVHLAARISLVFNGVNVPLLTKELYDNLIDRFNVLSKVVKREDKLISSEHLTHGFLQCEGRPDLARGFSINKTAAVLKTVDARFRNIASQCAEIDPNKTRNWMTKRAV
jgi:hypothetical protein